VDFGSNIGLSALYFLTHAPGCFVYCYEPLPRNCERLIRTLANFPGRYRLSASAVAPYAGEATFDYEETGRYGGVGAGFPQHMAVTCLRATEVVASVLQSHARIDVLKIDIEGLERDVLLSLPKEQRQRIENIYVETRFDGNPLMDTHAMRHYGQIAQFRRRQS
jgi:FkbM family methyltransferase